MLVVIQIFLFILSLSLLIVLHEFGHFITAKFFKVKVLKFYLFFDFLFPFIKDKNSWPFKKDVMYWNDWPVRSAALLFGGVALQNEDYLKTWESLNSNFNKMEIIRNVPVRFPLLWVK